MIRPTPQAVVIFACGVPLSLLMVIHDASWWILSFDYGLFVCIIMAIDVTLALAGRLFRIDIFIPEKLYVGEREAITAAIGPSPSGRPIRIELLCDQRGEVDPAEIVVADLQINRPIQVSIPLVPRRRGTVSIDRLWGRWRGPLSLVQCTRQISVERSVEVLPNVRGLHSAAVKFFSQEAIFGLKVQEQKGEGTEFEALREYVPGLDNRSIDWKHSARHRKLLCKEFKTERNHQVILSFDTGYLMLEPIDHISRLDHSINAALILAWISLQSGDFVGTYGFDAQIRQYLRPIRGISSFAVIQRATAGLAYHLQETNFTLALAELNARLKRRSLVILFTDFVDTVSAELLVESMQRLTNRHVLLFVTLRDPSLQRMVDEVPSTFDKAAQAVIAQDFLRDRSIVFERLERLGVHCLDVPVRGLSTGLVNRYLMIKRRGLI
jgi:uncharacterized protein (DUF58 family)